MGTYRFENSKSDRAKCKATTCGHEKIAKDELRQGTWVTMPGTDKGSWAWRHWGCVTAKIVSNIKQSLMDGDEVNWDLCDGLNDLHQEDQDKVREAIERGYIVDEDWRGAATGNRPDPPKAARKKKSSKAEDQDGDDGVDTKASGGTSTLEAELGEEQTEDMKKKTRPSLPKAKKEEADYENSDVEIDAEVTARKRGRPKKNDAAPAKATKPAPRESTRTSTRVKNVKSYKEVAEESGDSEAEVPHRKVIAKRGRAPSSKAASRKEEELGDADEEDAPEDSVKELQKPAKGGRPKDVKGPDTEGMAAPAKVPGKRGRKPKVLAQEETADISDTVKKVPGKRGRKPKEVVTENPEDHIKNTNQNENEVDSSEGGVKVPAKKRGRKPKNVAEEHPESSAKAVTAEKVGAASSEEVEKPEKSASKRGRKPATKADGNTAQEGTKKTTAKRQLKSKAHKGSETGDVATGVDLASMEIDNQPTHNIKRKAVDASEDETEEKIAPPQKKRGRPPKKVAEKETSSTRRKTVIGPKPIASLTPSEEDAPMMDANPFEMPAKVKISERKSIFMPGQK